MVGTEQGLSPRQRFLMEFKGLSVPAQASELQAPKTDTAAAAKANFTVIVNLPIRLG